MPLPPLAEQQRIVARLEELLPDVEAYGTAQERLTTLESSFPQQLRKSLLQEAIQGRLVPQNPADESADVLLQRIRAEKEQLIKEGKIKKQKPLPPITEEEKPFAIPDSWQWVRLGELCKVITDGTHSRPQYIDNGIPFISVKNISNGYIDFNTSKYISLHEHKQLIKRCHPQNGDLLISKVGTTGIPVIIDTNKEFSIFVSIALLKFITHINVHYIKHSINSPFIQTQVKFNTRGVGNKNWVLKDIMETVIPLPPLAEQQRIVARLEELLPLCGGLMPAGGQA